MKLKPLRQECEHFGDATARLAACELLYDLFKREQEKYFKHMPILVSNRNFATYYKRNPAGKRKTMIRCAKKFETEIGEIFFNNGVNFAVKTAKYRIKQTDEWLNILDYYNGKYPKNYEKI